MKIAVWEPVQAHREMMTVIWPTLKSMLMAGHKMTIEIKQSRRSTEQNAMFHSLIGKISTAMEAAGQGRRRWEEAFSRCLFVVLFGSSFFGLASRHMGIR